MEAPHIPNKASFSPSEKSPKNPFACITCDNLHFQTADSFLAHIRTTHGRNLKEIVVKFKVKNKKEKPSDTTKDNKENVYFGGNINHAYLKAQHPDDCIEYKKTFQCNHCDKKFSQLGIRNRHINRFHIAVDNQKLYQCQYCGKRATKGKVRSKNSFQCEECGRMGLANPKSD